MKLHTDFEQGSVAWLEAHCGIPTASEFGHLVTPKQFKHKNGEASRSFLARKLAEAWIGPLPGIGGSWFMEQGLILEGEARPFLEFEFGWKLRTVGFITTDDGRIGCSPDALLGDNCGVEIKCPEASTHVKYLLAGTLPPDYAPQVHGCMMVTGFPSWYFVSYRRGLPLFVLKVERDEEIQKAIQESVSIFLQAFDAGMERLIELNDGKPPPKRMKMVFADELRRAPRYNNEGITP